MRVSGRARATCGPERGRWVILVRPGPGLRGCSPIEAQASWRYSTNSTEFVRDSDVLEIQHEFNCFRGDSDVLEIQHEFN